MNLKKLSPKWIIFVVMFSITSASIILFLINLFANKGFRPSSDFPYIKNEFKTKKDQFDKNEKDFNYFFKFAKINDLKKDYEAGLYFINEAIKINPYSDKAYYLKAGLLYDLNRFQEVITVINKAIEINPKDPKYFYLRGISNSRLGNSEFAIGDLKKSISIDNKNPDILKVLAQMYFQIDNFELAKKYLSDFISLKPQDYEGYYLLGVTLQKLNDHPNAIKQFDKTIELNPRNANAYFNRAFSHWYIGNPEKSCGDYVSAQTLGINIKNNGIYSSLCN